MENIPAQWLVCNSGQRVVATLVVVIKSDTTENNSKNGVLSKTSKQTPLNTNSEWTTDLNVKCKAIKLFEDN